VSGGDEKEAGADDDKDKVVPHPVEPRARTAMLPPVLSKIVDTDPLTWLDFTQDAILTSCKSGHIRTWSRPAADGVVSLESEGKTDG